MHKKILALCAALVALGALAIPSLASGATTLRENGVVVPLKDGAGNPTKIVATGDGESIFEASGQTIKCNDNLMTGTLHRNDHTRVEGTITSVRFAGEYAGISNTRCDGGGLLGPTTVDISFPNGDWCVKNIPGEDRFEVVGNACTQATGTLTFTLTGSLECKYSTTKAVTGTFTTTGAPAATTLSVTGLPEFTRDGGSIFCPASGKITQMKFTLHTDNSPTHTNLQLDDV